MKRFAKKHSFKPTMEALETRWCPAASISPLQNGVAYVAGDDTNNYVVITQNDNDNTLTISAGSAYRQFTNDQVTGVNISLKGGDDHLTYRLGGGSAVFNGKDITADLGSGDDTATFNFADNGAGGPVTCGGGHPLKISVQAGADRDQVDAFFGRIDSQVTLTGNMGYGDDRFNAELKGNVQGYSTLLIDMEDMNDRVLTDPFHGIAVVTAPGGNDDFRVTCDPGVDIWSSNVDVTLKGGDGSDSLQFQFQGQVHNSDLNVLLDGGNGADTATADITLDKASDGTVNATVQGGNGDDTLALHITNPSTASVRGVLDGGDGIDHASKTRNVDERNLEFLETWLS